MLIVDTFNVLHAAPTAAPPGAQSLSGLTIDTLARLIQTSRFGGRPCLLVIDGTGGGRAASSSPSLPTGRSHDPRAHGVRLLFAGPGKDADALIEHLLDDLEHSHKARSAVVVSSDRRVQAAATGARASFLSSVDFLRQILSDADRRAESNHRQTRGKPSFAADPPVDPAAAQAWLKAFGIQVPPPSPSAPPAADLSVPQPQGAPSTTSNVPAPTKPRSADKPASANQSGSAKSPPDAPAPDRRRPKEVPPQTLDERALKELEEWAKSLDLDDLQPPTSRTPPPPPARPRR